VQAASPGILQKASPDGAKADGVNRHYMQQCFVFVLAHGCQSYRRHVTDERASHRAPLARMQTQGRQSKEVFVTEETNGSELLELSKEEGSELVVYRCL
jgi:hypothetical protein